MIDFMILNILQKAGLAKSIEQIGLMVIRKWDIKNQNWVRRDSNKFVALKSLNNSKNVTLEFLNEV